MESKHIKGTNEQYSIREDGVVLKHYNNTRGAKSYLEKELCIHNGLSTIYKNKIKTTVSISILLFDYFGFKYCNKCNNKFKKKRLDITCKKCLVNTGNYLKTKEQIKRKNSKVTKILTKSYIASVLGIKVSGLSEELYHHHRNTILFKRKVSKENNISIQSLN